MNYQEKVKAISTKALMKDLINNFSILSGPKYFSVGVFQNYLLLIQLKNTLNILVALLGLNSGYRMEKIIGSIY